METPVAHILFFFNDTATTEIYTLSLHDALPISGRALCLPSRLRLHDPGHGRDHGSDRRSRRRAAEDRRRLCGHLHRRRSEEHTSELQSRQYLVCRLLLEKKKNTIDKGKIDEAVF